VNKHRRLVVAYDSDFSNLVVTEGVIKLERFSSRVLQIRAFASQLIPCRPLAHYLPHSQIEPLSIIETLAIVVDFVGRYAILAVHNLPQP